MSRTSAASCSRAAMRSCCVRRSADSPSGTSASLVPLSAQRVPVWTVATGCDRWRPTGTQNGTNRPASVEVGGYPSPSTTSDIAAFMPAADARRLAEVSPRSLDGWEGFARRYGSSRTALAEVIGLHLATFTGPLDELPEPIRGWAHQAMERTANQRSRGRQ